MNVSDFDTAQVARWFHALSDETRIGIVRRLSGGERCVCDLQGDLAAAQSRLSFHLKVLKDAEIVTDRKVGRWSYYALNPEALEAMGAFLGAARPSEQAWVQDAGGCCR